MSDEILEACASIPYSMLDLHRIFVKSINGKLSFKFVKKNNVDECLRFKDWYEYGGERRTERESLVSSDPTIEKYTNVEEFVDECCTINSDNKVLHRLLYKRYTIWCQTSRIPSIEIRTFIKSLKKLGYVLKQDTWLGISLN
jgi:hypothetical protein